MNHKSGFTLIELIVVVVLMASLSLFLGRYQASNNQSKNQVKSAARMILALFENAKNMAIAQNQCVHIAIDLSSKHRQRRMFLLQNQEDRYVIKQEITLPERTAILNKTQLETCLEQDLNNYDFDQKNITLLRDLFKTYFYTFCPDGSLLTDNAILIGVGYVYKSDIIYTDSDVDCSGVLITAMGKAILLPSKKVMKEIL